MDDQTRVNRKIDLPGHVFIPSSVVENGHLKCAYTRFNGRFPTVIYHDKVTGATLWRSSQLSVDIQTGRTTDDENYLKMINSTTKDK